MENEARWIYLVESINSPRKYGFRVFSKHLFIVANCSYKRPVTSIHFTMSKHSTVQFKGNFHGFFCIVIVWLLQRHLRWYSLASQYIYKTIFHESSWKIRNNNSWNFLFCFFEIQISFSNYIHFWWLSVAVRMSASFFSLDCLFCFRELRSII